MTPEQKAFFEYGKARCFVIQFSMLEKNYPDTELTVNGSTHPISEWKAAAIEYSWQLRKECRTWVPIDERTCRNCLHGDEVDEHPICVKCCNAIHRINWQPRKD